MLSRLGEEAARLVTTIPGAADTKLEQTGGLPFLRMRVDREEIARYGINASHVLHVVETIGGKVLGK